MSAALSGYLSAVEKTENTVLLELQALSDSLVTNNDLPVIAQVCAYAVVHSFSSEVILRLAHQILFLKERKQINHTSTKAKQVAVCQHYSTIFFPSACKLYGRLCIHALTAVGLLGCWAIDTKGVCGMTAVLLTCVSSFSLLGDPFAPSVSRKYWFMFLCQCQGECCC